VYINKITLKNFRCFNQLSLAFPEQAQKILITGLNGSGKTSLLEALHYGCYLRSFRTHLPKELITDRQDTFFIKITVEHDFDMHDISIGFTGKKRLVKIDQKPIGSYKELSDYYRIITLTEDDLQLVKGSPEIRRSFLDQGLIISNPAFISVGKTYRQGVEQRNALFGQSFSQESYHIWTQKLWQQSREIQQLRRQLLKSLEESVNQLLQRWFDPSMQVQFNYQSKGMPEDQSYEDFLGQSNRLLIQEKDMRRSLFGAHLDDFSIIFTHRQAKAYASRGQQKLLTLLIKIAQLQQLDQNKAKAIFLLDDFMTDFDPEKATILLNILNTLDCQTIFTSPITQGPLERLLIEQGAYVIQITY